MAQPDSLEGRIFSRRYLLGPALGEGGMGTVYRATDLRTGGTVAVKVVRPSLMSDPNYVTRLRREATNAARIDSPRVVRIIDLNTEDNITYFVMEYVDGKTLAERLRSGPLTVRQALYVAREIAWALDAIHSSGVVHRDLKPQNIKVDAGGAVKLLDFGIARKEGDTSVTSVGMFVGSPMYAAPERIDGQNDIRGDIYAAGAILYEMLTGSPPFTGATPMSVLRKHATEPVPPLPATVPERTRAVVMRCLAKQPEHRYQTPRELAEALTAAITEVGGTAEVRGMGDLDSNTPPHHARATVGSLAEPTLTAPATSTTDGMRVLLFATIGAGGTALVLLLVLLVARSI